MNIAKAPRDMSRRAGGYLPTLGGFQSFMPAPLPPTPPIVVDDELLGLLSDANLALGRLDASAEILPNPDLFVSMYVRKEAVLSSQIEGTQASLTDILEFEALRARRGTSHVAEVVNYVQALNHGLARLPEIPISNRLIREIHRVLLTGVIPMRSDHAARRVGR